MLAIVGPNGAGKSTLLRLMAGDIVPTNGQIDMADRALANWSRPAAARVRAVVPQSSSVLFPFRVFQVVAMGRTPMAGLAPAEQNMRIAGAAMKQADVAHLADRFLASLSGGEQQRVMIARALAQLWSDDADYAGKYLLLDEPTASLDIAHQQSALSLGRDIARAGGTVVTVLHDFNLASQFADKIAILSDGRLVKDGAPADAFRPDVLEQVFQVPMRVTLRPDINRPLIIPLTAPQSGA